MTRQLERFLPPELKPNTIGRDNIVMRIKQFSRRGILFIHSPAGYGKTTSAALWLRGKNAAWISLDEYSCSPAEFFKAFLLALSCPVPDRFSVDPLGVMLEVLHDLANWPEAVVIDDFHLCSDSSAARALPLIRARMPANMPFVILSRTPPPHSLQDMVLKGMIKQISDLEFTRDEIVLLFEKSNLPIDNYTAGLMEKQTGGWAAALSAIVMAHGDAEAFSDAKGLDALNQYFKYHAFAGWENFDVLKACSICDILYPGLCAAVTGREDAWDVIIKLAGQTGLAAKLTDNAYQFHALLKDFLRTELMADKNIDKMQLYMRAANWYMDNGDLERGVSMAAKTGNMAFIEECSRLKSSEYGRFGTDISLSSMAIEEHLLNIFPSGVIKQSFRLSLDGFSCLFYMGRLHEAFAYLDAAKSMPISSRLSRIDLTVLALLLSVDPRGNVWDIPEHFKYVLSFVAQSKSDDAPRFLTLTSNLPFFHKAQVDYGDISPRLDEFLSRAVEHMSPIFGSAIKPLILLLEAGIRYERGELACAEKIAEEAILISERFPAEIRFSAFAMQAEILYAQGRAINFERIEEMITTTEAHYLSANWGAFMTNTQLRGGKTAAATAWMSRTEVEKPLRMYKVYQYLTTARSLIATGKLPEAENLLQRLEAFSRDYRRNTDLIEILVLQSICRWHTKHVNEAVNAMTAAIREAGRLRIVMPIVKEGADVTPILQKILNRLKYGYDADILNKPFVSELFHGAQKMSRHTRSMFAENETKPVKLSSRQAEILGYMRQNLTHQEMCELMGIKNTTIDAHISRLYEKLGVSNVREAVVKATELGLFNNDDMQY